jgi:hypothetical protein
VNRKRTEVWENCEREMQIAEGLEKDLVSSHIRTIDPVCGGGEEGGFENCESKKQLNPIQGRGRRSSMTGEREK